MKNSCTSEKVVSNKVVSCAHIYDFIEEKKDIDSKSKLVLLEKELLNKTINIAETNVQFNDMCWNFTQHAKEGEDRGRYIYIFSNKYIEQNRYYSILLKYYVTYLYMYHGSNFVYMKHKFSVSKAFLTYLQKNEIYSVSKVDTNIIKKFLELRPNKYVSTYKKKVNLKEFIIFFSTVFTNIYDGEVSKYLELRDWNKIKITIEENKLPLLPDDIMLNLTTELVEMVKSNKIGKMDRGIAGIIYILIQIGCRISEGVMFKVGDLIDLKEGIKAIRYYSLKSKKHVIMIANKSVVDIFNILKELFADERNEKDSQLLVLLSNTSRRNDPSDFSVRTDHIRKWFNTLCYSYADKWKLYDREDKECFALNLSQTQIKDYIFTRNIEDKNYSFTVLCIPAIHQFRVYFTTKLHNELGISYQTIAMLQGQEPEMAGYYGRVSDPISKEFKQSRKIYMDILDGFNIIGPQSEILKNKINTTINDGRIQTKSESEILGILMKDYPIKTKYGGFCIKRDNRRECRHDGPTDEIYCAYGYCINQHHTCLTVDVAYSKFRDLVLAYTLNEKKGYIIQNEKELYKMEHIFNLELIPEINELKKEMKIRGKEELIERNANLHYIVDNITYIEQEIEIWKKKIIEMKVKRPNH